MCHILTKSKEFRMKSTHIFTQRAQRLLFVGLLGLLPYTGHNLGAQNEAALAPKIEKVEFNKNLLTPEGKFTETSLPRFLAKAYREKKLLDDTFSKEACLKAKDIGSQGGMQTSQLFLVTSICHPTQASMYIIKEATSGITELESLREIEQFPGIKALITPKKVEGLPSIALPFAYFSYANGGMHYIAAMPAAKGKPLSSIIVEFRDNQSPQNQEKLARAFKILGREISAFHKQFMKKNDTNTILGKTVVHGDFHFFNIFYDEIGGHFTLIDNESMIRSMNNGVSPSVDIMTLFMMPFTTDSGFTHFKDLIKGINIKTWCDIVVKNFVTGYLEPYKPTERKQVLQELKKIFNEDDFSIRWFGFDDQELKNLREKYINPVFDEIQKTV